MGAVTSVVFGAALPIHIYLYGQVINQFVFYQQADTIYYPIVQSLADTLNRSCEYVRDLARNGTIDLTLNVINSSNSSESFICQQTSVSSNALRGVCDADITLIEEINNFTIIYIGLGFGVLVALLFSIMLLNITAYRQTQKIRKAFYKSILRQDIEWFDITKTAQLSAHLAE